MKKQENPGTVAAVHGAIEAKAGEDLIKQNTPHNPLCQSAAAQRAKILEWLLNVGPLTTFDSREKLLIPHPAGRVQELRRLGNNIVTERCWEYSAGGSRHCVARYTIKQEVQP